MAGRAKPFAALPGQSAGEDLLRGCGSSLRGKEPAPGISLRALPKANGALAGQATIPVSRSSCGAIYDSSFLFKLLSAAEEHTDSVKQPGLFEKYLDCVRRLNSFRLEPVDCEG